MRDTLREELERIWQRKGCIYPCHIVWWKFGSTPLTGPIPLKGRIVPVRNSWRAAARKRLPGREELH